MDVLFIVIFVLIYCIVSLIKYKQKMEKLDTEERIYRLRHGLPSKDEEDIEMKAREKLEKWVEENPNGYLEKGYRKIAAEIGINHSTVAKNILKIIADRDGLIVSQVRFKRKQAGLSFINKGDVKLSDEQIKKIRELHKKYEIADIACIVKVDECTVKKYLSKVRDKELE